MQSKFFNDGNDNKITVNQIFKMKKNKEKVAEDIVGIKKELAG